jgi:hypothetical protein
MVAIPIGAQNCTNSLAELHDADLLMKNPNLDLGQPVVVATPTGKFDSKGNPFWEYDFTWDPNKIAPVVAGVIVPNVEDPFKYTVSSQAVSNRNNIDATHQVNGCWGTGFAIVYAQPGIYSFALFDSNTNVLMAAAMEPGIVSLCPTTLPVAAVALGGANFYNPLPATADGVFIENSGDPAINLVRAILDARGIAKTDYTGVGNMATKIGTIKANNGNNPINVVEIGHGEANRWVNVAPAPTGPEEFTTTAVVTSPLNTLEAAPNKGGAQGNVARFDTFSCLVAANNVTTVGNPPFQTAIPLEVMAHLGNGLSLNNSTVTIRAINVPIKICSVNLCKPTGILYVNQLNFDTNCATSWEAVCTGQATGFCTATKNHLAKGLKNCRP